MPTQSGKRELSDLPPREMRHAIAWSSFRTIVAVVGIIGAYAVMPLGVDDIKAQGVLFAIVGLGLFVWVFIRQLRKIQDADFPVLRAAQALVLVVSLFLTIFAAASVALETSTPGSFNEGLTRIDGFYYAVTTMATVGFGDIHPASQTARVLGTVQMLGNLMLLGVAVRLIGRAVDRSRL